MSNRDYASKQLNKIRNRITEAAESANRMASSVSIIGAAKQQDSSMLDSFVDVGLEDIGENYLSDASEHQQQLTGQVKSWHFIGTIQSNKTKKIASTFDWVHTLDRFKIAQRLSDHCPQDKKLHVLVQINIDNEPSKGGVAIQEVGKLCQQIDQLPNLVLRGFMLIPQARQGFSQQRQPFAQARELMHHCNHQYSLQMDTLSMGMSGDLEAAIAEGSTMVRIGADLFGARSY